jgi:hypothetical protein
MNLMNLGNRFRAVLSYTGYRWWMKLTDILLAVILAALVLTYFVGI